jgi:hypothetical protein
MSLPEPSFHDVDRMLRHLEMAIDTDTATPQLLAVMQKRLDIIDEKHRDDPAVADQYYKLLELQALIHGTHLNDVEAKKFLAAAIKMAGGASKLSSRLLKAYIASHVAAAASTRAPAPTAPRQASTPTPAPEPRPTDDRRAERGAAPAKEHKAKRFHFGRKKLFTIAGIAVVLLAVGVWLGPLDTVVSALYPSEQRTQIKQQQAVMQSLTDQYNKCSTEIKARATKVDSTDPEAVDKYNKDLASCDAVRVKQNTAVDKYNTLTNTKKPA